uniref:hypothetical protein n=1 Tax=Acetatifactor sp. TaxID=1872090 RepID=UPI004056ED99
MKKKLAGLRMVCGICAAIGWWGFLYPELTMTQDTYTVVREEEVTGTEEDGKEGDSEEDVYRMILETDGERIRYRSRFLMQLESVLKMLK